MSEKNNSSNQNKGGFWTTLPGILTALGTLIVAITGLIAILHKVGIIGGGGSNPEPTPVITTSKPETNTTDTDTNIPFGFVIGGATPTPANLARLVKDQIGQFPNMKICESNIGEADPFYLVIESVGSESEANTLKERIQENGKFLPGTYTMYSNQILLKKFKIKECKRVNDY